MGFWETVAKSFEEEFQKQMRNSDEVASLKAEVKALKEENETLRKGLDAIEAARQSGKS